MNAKSAESPAGGESAGMRPAATQAAAGTGGARERGSLAYLLSAVGLIAVVGVLVVVFGVVHPPALPSIKAAGVTPPGGVAWTQYDDRDNCTALMVARTDGTVDRLTCDENGGDVVAWTHDGIVVLSWIQSGSVLLTVDPATGEMVTRDAVTGDYGGGGVSNVSTSRTDGTLVVRLEPGDRELWTVDAPRGYDVRAGASSPDGSWVVMTDSAERLLLVSADGGSPAVWANGASTSWMAPVWEGTAIPAGATDPNKRK